MQGGRRRLFVSRADVARAMGLQAIGERPHRKRKAPGTGCLACSLHAMHIMTEERQFVCQVEGYCTQVHMEVPMRRVLPD